MVDEMNNLMELNKFENANPDIVKSRSNGDREFNARIVFEYLGNIVRENAIVVIHKTTWEGGQITITEGDKINSDDLHCQFITRFQMYKCSEEGFLVISDKSPKLGRYKVTIIPTN